MTKLNPEERPNPAPLPIPSAPHGNVDTGCALQKLLAVERVKGNYYQGRRGLSESFRGRTPQFLHLLPCNFYSFPGIQTRPSIFPRELRTRNSTESLDVRMTYSVLPKMARILRMRHSPFPKLYANNSPRITCHTELDLPHDLWRPSPNSQPPYMLFPSVERKHRLP